MLRQILLNVDLAELAARLEPEGKTELEANSVQADSETPAICGDDKDKTEKVEEKTSSHKVLNNDFMKFPLRMEGKL